jgi:hypothetical protein
METIQQRRQKRRHLLYYLEVHEQQTGKLLGHVADLTVDGLLLVGGQELKDGQLLDIDIELPQTPGFEGESLKTSSIVRWSGQDKNPSLHCVGLQFQNVGPREQANIELLFKAMGFSDN